MIHGEIPANPDSAARPTPVEPLRPFAESRGASGSQNVVSQAAMLVGRLGCQIHCGITLTVGSVPETIAATDDIPIRLDRLQRDLGHGPSMPPGLSEPLVISGELGEDLRWPDFGMMCVSVLGIRSLLSVRIPLAGEGHAFLTLSSEAPAAFGDHDKEAATEFARLAVPAASRGWRELDAFSAVEASSRTGRLATALGIVMARYRLKSAPAFEMLNQSSQVLRWSLLAMASEVVHTGRLPARDICEVRRSRHPGAEATYYAPHPADQLTA